MQGSPSNSSVQEAQQMNQISGQYTNFRNHFNDFISEIGGGSTAGLKTYKYPDGSTYRGNYASGVRQGFGELISGDGKSYYLGNWAQDQMKGKGLYIWPTYGLVAAFATDEDGSSVQDWKPSGAGRVYIILPDDSNAENVVLKFEGDLQDGNPHGEAISYHNNGKKQYEGGFSEGKPNGEGRSFYESGSIEYEGGFKDGEPHGEGRAFKENGDVEYEGSFKDGKPG